MKWLAMTTRVLGLLGVLPALVVLAGCAPTGLHARRVGTGGVRSDVTIATFKIAPTADTVLAAYMRSRDVDVHAFASLDVSGLATVFADSALASRLNEIEQRRRDGRPMAVHMEHHPHVTMLGPALAVVDDDVVNHSVRLDPVTRRPVETDPDELLQDTYTLERREGRWLVVLTARVGS